MIKATIYKGHPGHERKIYTRWFQNVDKVQNFCNIVAPLIYGFGYYFYVITK